jgi:hypothetical protein
VTALFSVWLGLVKLGDGKDAPAAGAAGGRVAALLTGRMLAVPSEPVCRFCDYVWLVM